MLFLPLYYTGNHLNLPGVSPVYARSPQFCRKFSRSRVSNQEETDPHRFFFPPFRTESRPFRGGFLAGSIGFCRYFPRLYSLTIIAGQSHTRGDPPSDRDGHRDAGCSGKLLTPLIGLREASVNRKGAAALSADSLLIHGSESPGVQWDCQGLLDQGPCMTYSVLRWLGLPPR